MDIKILHQLGDHLLDTKRALDMLNRGMCNAETPIAEIRAFFEAAVWYNNQALQTLSAAIRRTQPDASGQQRTTK